MRQRYHVLTLATVTWFWGSVAWAGATPPQKCQGGKNKVAGKYSACLLSAAGKLVTTGDTGKYTDAVTKCQDKFEAAWQKLETNSNSSCPTSGDQSNIQDVVDTGSSTVSALLSNTPVFNFTLPLVTAYYVCTTPGASTDHGLLPLPACSPPIPRSSTLHLGSGGSGTVEVQRVSGPDVRIKVTLTDVRTTPGNALFNDPLDLVATMRVTNSVCTVSSVPDQPCTAIDISGVGGGDIPITCSNGNCSADTTLNTLNGSLHGAYCCPTATSQATGCDGTTVCTSNAQCTNPSYPICVKLIQAGKQATIQLVDLSVLDAPLMMGGQPFLVPGLSIP